MVCSVSLMGEIGVLFGGLDGLLGSLGLVWMLLHWGIEFLRVFGVFSLIYFRIGYA